MDSALNLPRAANVVLYQSTSIGNNVFSDTTDGAGAFGFDSVYISQPPVVQYDRIVIQPEIPYAVTSVKPVVVDTENLAINPRLVYEGAKKKGLTYEEVATLGADDPAALGDLMFL